MSLDKQEELIEKEMIKSCFSTSIDIVWSAILGPIWSIIELVKCSYSSAKQIVFNDFLLGIYKKAKKEKLSEKDIEKFSKKLDKQEYFNCSTYRKKKKKYCTSHQITENSVSRGLDMSKELPFMVLCIEEYKNQKRLSGKEVIELFNKYSVLEYVQSFYEALHTTGTKYIVNDIDLYIKSFEKK